MNHNHRVGVPPQLHNSAAATAHHTPDDTTPIAMTASKGNSSSSGHGKGHGLGFAHHGPPANRVFLWHKDTDPFRALDQRQQAGGYYENVKVLTSGPRHCIDRIFDLAADPFERRNLLKGPYTSVYHCPLGIASADVNAIRSALSHGDLQTAAIASHCNHGADMSDEDEKQAQEFVQDKDKDKEACKVHYINILTFKTMVILRKLLPFVRDGKRGHDKYMSKTADKATCSVPIASMIEPLDYLTDKGCESHRFGCSEPEY